MAEAERRLMPKALSQLIQTCDELIESEGKYVETLETIVEVFLVPLRTWAKEDDAKNAGLISHSEYDVSCNCRT